MKNHNYYMQLAIKEAKKAWGKTSPNPLVGSVIVKNDKIIGIGYHHKSGNPHAEIEAINSCTETPEGATCYVTLEPCSSYGRTPPCTEALIKAKFKHIVIGSLDDNAKHQGKAIEIFEQNKIKVTCGILKEQCREINKPFFHWIKTNKPLVTLKMAMTLDGKIATKTGESKWITSPKSRSYVQTLRKRCDAIIVGGNTVTLDNPSLTVSEKNWQQPQKFIWSSQKFSPELKVMQNNRAEIIKPKNKNQWNSFLKKLGEQNYTNLLIEGGGELAANCIKANIVDEVYFFIAPKILCGQESRPVVGGTSPKLLSECHQLVQTSVELIGEDILIKGNINNSDK